MVFGFNPSYAAVFPSYYADAFIAILGIIVFANLALFLAKKPKVQLAANSFMFLVLAAACFALSKYGSAIGLIMPSGGTLISFSSFSLFFGMLFGIGMFLINVLAFSKTEAYQRFSLFSSLVFTGLYLVSFAGSFISIIIGMEIITLPTVLILLSGGYKTIEAAVKLFIMSAIAASSLAFGIVFYYGAANTVLFTQASEGVFLAGAAILAIAALGFESSIFPFNLWVPDVYEGARADATALLGSINKKAGFVALILVLFAAFGAQEAQMTPILYIISILTMFYGNILALSQKNVKRMLAYSSISQAGYILIGIVTATGYGIAASIFQIAAHMFMFMGAMAIVYFMEKNNNEEVDNYVGLYRSNKFAAIVLTIMMLGFIGTPLTAGFIGKFLIFSSAVYNNMVLLAVIAIINTIISVYYYLKIMLAMFASKETKRKYKMDLNITAVAAACLIIVVVLGVYPGPVISMASAAAASLHI